MFRVVKAKTIQHLEARITQLQHTVGDVLTALAEHPRKYTGNPYPSYDSQALETARKYEGCAEWGCMLTQNIIDIRACFIMGQGVKPTIREGKDGKKELEFINRFLRYNNIDMEIAQKWATEAEIEGKWLVALQDLKLPPEEVEKGSGIGLDEMIEAKFISWSDQKYTVNTEADDYTKIINATYKIKGTGKEVTIPEAEMVYARFGGRLTKINNTPPKIGKVLLQIENLDRALYDWRRINELFASPTPHFKCETEELAEAVQAQLQDIDWKIGKAIATVAEYKLVGLEGSGSDALEKEITNLVKVISGSTGVPVHFLGLPDLLSNRSTADNLTELVTSATNDERQTWRGAYNELFSKVLRLANAKFGRNYDPNALDADLPQVSSQKIKELVEVWLPLIVAGKITLKTFLSKVPDVDPEAEAKGIEEEKKKAMKEMLAAMPAPNPQPSNRGSNNNPAPAGGKVGSGGIAKA